MSLALFVSPKWAFFDDNGDPASGWLLYTYQPGTSTAKTTYQDSSAVTPHANPIVLDARGEAEIWLDGQYKFVLKTAAGVEKWSSDDIGGVGANVQTGYLTKSVAGGSDVALTSIEQGNSVIELTGPITANINVTVDDDKDGHQWIVKNSTTGAFTVTFKTDSGTGVAIDQSATAIVYHDGTNIDELVTLSAQGLALLDDATAAAQRATLGSTTVGDAVFIATDAAAARTALALGTVATKNTGTASGEVPLVGTASATDALAGLVEKATDAEIATGTDTDRYISPAGLRASALVLATAVSASGTAVDFTSIPSWAKRITVIMDAVSTNGTSIPLLQIGDSGGIENTSYVSTGQSTSSGGTNVSTNTSGFIMAGVWDAAYVMYGHYVLTKITGTTWVVQGNASQSSIHSARTGGSKALSATLDRVRITTVNGTDTFDAGTINIMYE